ncbi:MAG: hypothetical protein GXN91_04600 [Epsilonproteobacteria bacterium]|nr:hypothetical protein [Campylobacterota bacterium]
MRELFNNYSTIIIFLHVLSAVVWIGGMIAIRVAVHPTMHTIEDKKIRVGKTLMIVGRLFNLVMPFIALLLITAIIMIVALDLKGGIVYAKEGIWTIMTINYLYMYYRRSKAQRLFDKGELQEAVKLVANIPHTLLPINIFLGVVAIYLGVVLRGL